MDAADGAAAGAVLGHVLDVDEIPQRQVAVGEDEQGIGMQLVQRVLHDGPLDGAVEAVSGEVGVDHAEIAVLGQVDRGLGVLVHQASDTSGPVAGGQGKLVGVLVAQGIEELQGRVEGTTAGKSGQVTTSDFRRDPHGGLLATRAFATNG